TVLNTYGIGGWLRWRHPDLNPVIDGLATPYPASFTARYHAAVDADPGWRTFVRDAGAPAALLMDGTPLIPKLLSSGWHVEQSGDGYRLLLAPTPPAGG
ncbi:MAG: hypothetical protein WAV00_05745, partial [Nocardioides sp.]